MQRDIFQQNSETMQTLSVPQPPQTKPAAWVIVVGGEFCIPYNVDLIVAEKPFSFFTKSVADTSGNVLLEVKRRFLILWGRYVLFDGAGRPLLTMQQKIMNADRSWQVFRGDSLDTRNLLFSVKKSSLFQSRTELNVFLVGNNSEHACDFKVKGSHRGRSCTVYAGCSNTVIAKMRKQHRFTSKGAYGVTVYPNVDYAFLTSLIVILNEINKDRKD